MSGKKLPGEEATVINSPTLAMAAGKQDLSKMGGSAVCSGDGTSFKMPKSANLFKNAGNKSNVDSVDQQVTFCCILILRNFS